MSQENMSTAATILQESLGISHSLWMRGNFSIRPVEHLFYTEIRDRSARKPVGLKGIQK